MGTPPFRASPPDPARRTPPRSPSPPPAPSPPEYAWDWFARQRLLWREVRRRLAAAGDTRGDRYHAAETKGEVLSLLKDDYGLDARVRRQIADVVAELAFLGRTDVPFEQLGVPAPPRGLRWWWTEVTGERLPTTRPSTAPADPHAPVQLSLDEIQQGLGG